MKVDVQLVDDVAFCLGHPLLVTLIMSDSSDISGKADPWQAYNEDDVTKGK